MEDAEASSLIQLPATVGEIQKTCTKFRRVGTKNAETN